jgi:dihydroorotate dehydrogenase electron transfer subunit
VIRSYTSKIIESERVAPEAVRLRLEMADGKTYRAGQFVHLRVDEAAYYPLLRRPFSTWDTGEGWIDVLYAIKGKGTQLLAQKGPGETIGMLGPLGNSFSMPPKGKRITFVAGGVGIVPFYIFAKQILAQEPKADITLLFGARGRDYLFGLEQLQQLPQKIEIATEDGSVGHKGYVTDLLKDPDVVYGCGPDPMLKALARIVTRKKIWCEMSLETHMGCALGACRACVTPVKTSDGWRYSRVCCEGPNYNVEDLVLE